MPAIPIVAGAIAMYGGATAAAFGTMTLAGVAAGAMVVGGAMTTAGALTKNKKLSQWGGYISLAGGLGSLATNLASGASTAATASEVGSTADAAGLASGNIVGSTGAETFGNVLGATADVAGASGAAGAAGAVSSTGLSAGTELASNAALGITGNAATSVANTAGGLSTNTASLATNIPTTSVGALDSLNGALGKYDKLLNLGAGLADGYQKEQMRRDALKFNNDRVALGNRNQNLADAKFANQVSNSNADFNLNVNYKPNASGMLYKGITQQPLPTRRIV